MIPYSLATQVAQEQQKDRVRAAQHAQLIQKLKAKSTNHNPTHRLLITWFGLKLVTWGVRLQQYHRVSSPAAMPANLKRH